jgi:hypothetical protein
VRREGDVYHVVQPVRLIVQIRDRCDWVGKGRELCECKRRRVFTTLSPSLGTVDGRGSVSEVGKVMLDINGGLERIWIWCSRGSQ